MLDKILGPNRAVVQAAVVMDWTQREITSNTYDPTPAAIRSSQKLSEAYNVAGAINGGIPGRLPICPHRCPPQLGAPPLEYYQRTEETINYELSQVQSREVTAPGKVDRITVR